MDSNVDNHFMQRKSTPDGLSSGGELVAEALVAHGVDTIFCVPGESHLDILDALRDSRPPVRIVVARHENGAVNMAEAYAKLTGKLGVCLVARAPGACNAAIGIHTARQDSIPLLMIVGQVPTTHRRREAFQEADIRWMFGDLAKAAEELTNPADIPERIARAIRTALSGRPGPVVLALPEDCLRDRLSAPPSGPFAPYHEQPRGEDIARIAERLGRARRPLILVGGSGWTDAARTALQTFAEVSEVPVITAFRGHDLFDNRHRLFAGDLGIGPGPELMKTVTRADCLLVIGARFDEMTTQGYSLFAGGAPDLLHIHADQEELNRVFAADVALAADTEAAILALLDHQSDGVLEIAPGRAAWCNAVREGHDKDRQPTLTGGRLDLAACMAMIDEKLARDAIMVVDAGNFSAWPQRFVSYGGGRRLLGPGSGAMGYGVPAAVAAKIANPMRQVVACVGDGGFGMTGLEILTALDQGVAPVLLVFNNGLYGTIRMHQEMRFPGRALATSLTNPHFAALAESCGAIGIRVEETHAFGPALDRALSADRVTLIELMTDPDVITPRTTLSAIAANAANR
ncbi:MAG: thiamine pyrophosphate-binding protein [Rhodospirillales bacterium]